MCHYGKKYFIGILQALQENDTITKAWIINMEGEGERLYFSVLVKRMLLNETGK